ncbi:RNA polymerase sigma factor region1.1 domain-containing protein, partial [Novosphingobium sp. 9U]|uniref:RNA polymerase sigma factor region1.1 domain-containing protein n=1 Tax=Novosphingobium sp. 9U TaxID=2653158 RepID=UPI0027392B9A
MSNSDLRATSDVPLIDDNESGIEQFIARAKRRGFVTIEDVEAALPADEVSTDQIEQIMGALSEMGVKIVENEEGESADAEAQADADPENDDAEGDGRTGQRTPSNGAADNLGRTDDPVRMYLREMGAVEMLSREGEAAVAKRIEAGRDMMILGLCESPMTFHAIIQWSEALNSGEMQLREILDLDAMYATEPTSESMSAEGEAQITEAAAGPAYKEDEDEDIEPERLGGDDEGDAEGGAKKAGEEEEDNTLNLAQLEAALKDDALAKFAEITEVFRTFEKLQRERLDALALGIDFPVAKEQQYHELREELTALVESVRFHATKIEYLIDNLYAFNRRLT